MRTTDSAFAGRILERLKNSEWWTPATRISGSTVQALTCPACGVKGAGWAYLATPLAINCNRLSQCGARTKTLELFPELKTSFDRDFQPTKDDPHRPAREYLLSRGIPQSLLTGLNFWYLRDCRGTGSGAVMFTVGKDDKGKQQANGRIFNPPAGEGKTHNIGSTAGRHWQHPGFAYDPARPVWIVEAILDGLSLLALDCPAIAALAAGQDPGKLDLAAFPRKILAFDNDEAGRAAVRKWRKAFPDAEVILCDPGRDWNDLLTGAATVEQAKKQLEQALPRFRNNGELALATSAEQWASIYHQFYQRAPGLFEFQRETYFSRLKTPRGSDTPFLETRRILQATIKATGYTIDNTNPANPEYRYNLEVTASRPGARPSATIATGADLNTARNLNEFLLSHARVNFEGDIHAATALQRRITNTPAALEAHLLPTIGYQPDSGAYVFPQWAIDSSGQLLHPDKHGLFRLGYNRYYRPPAHGESKAIHPAAIGKEQVQTIHRFVLQAWGLNGAVALAWTVAGWFVHQVKEETDFFPFLSLWGEPASGKSALATLLNNIQGREGEGLPVNQLNTRKGLTRTIGQVSNMFTGLLEDNERSERGFDYSVLLTGFNRGPLQVQATFSADLHTKETPFLGSLLFVQNQEPFNTKAERQRVISLQFKAEAITDATRAAYEQLMNLGRKTMAGVMQQVLAHRTHFEGNWQEAYSAARTDLAPLAERRILDNHALILGFHRLFCACFDIGDDPAVTAHFKHLGKQKCITSAQRQATIADHFFELLDLLEDEIAPCAYQIDLKRRWLIVNLPECERLLRNRSVNFQATEALHKALQQHPSYIRHGLTYRFPDPPKKDNPNPSKEIDAPRPTKMKRAWVFDTENLKNNQLAADESE